MGRWSVTHGTKAGLLHVHPALLPPEGVPGACCGEPDPEGLAWERPGAAQERRCAAGEGWTAAEPPRRCAARRGCAGASGPGCRWGGGGAGHFAPVEMSGDPLRRLPTVGRVARPWAKARAARGAGKRRGRPVCNAPVGARFEVQAGGNERARCRLVVGRK